MAKTLIGSYEFRARTPGGTTHIGAEISLAAAPDGGWIATQVEDGRTYTGTAEYAQAAIIALVADRLGFRAMVESKDDQDA